MVYDKIENLQQYLRLSEDIAVALRYLQSLDKDVVNENDFEAHVEYLDIHFPLVGKEKISCIPLEKTMLKKEYSSENDISFYKYSENDSCDCYCR